MIGYLPEIYPDELVYSWFSRYLVHSGHRLHSVVLRELFCKRSDNPSKEFLGHLNEDVKNIIQLSLLRQMNSHVLDEFLANNEQWKYVRYLYLQKLLDILEKA